jgi:hypothetical protein
MHDVGRPPPEHIAKCDSQDVIDSFDPGIDGSGERELEHEVVMDEALELIADRVHHAVGDLLGLDRLGDDSVALTRSDEEDVVEAPTQ